MDARRILHIPLSGFPHNDYQVWFGEAFGEFTVRNVYRFILQQSPMAIQLQNQKYYSNFYKKLWGLDLPSELKITFWCVTKNFFLLFTTYSLKGLPIQAFVRDVQENVN
ncbi:hypothetical protein J1N35_001198 [Gossypium stocksii]|uniref:Reverse transcriptase zinc-binding domain-containing protein n=1 Tax=Gossypium stocksii TaxID=47602 RepID=A0A9D3WIM5_9ROSI|nr:hypothetical protein J1N35_001198 [Gossypium stocksii]